MKYSLYNTHLYYKQHIIICNTITLGYVVLTEELHNLIRELQVEELQNAHNSLYVAFIDKGIIIDDSVDEHIKLRDIEINADFGMDSYHLIINPTLDCNFKCWYCFENKHKGSVMSESVLANVCTHIRRVLEEQKIKKFTLSFFGGEPLLYYKRVALPLIQELNKHKKDVIANIHFTTNGFLLSEKMVKQMNLLGVSSLQITLDGDKAHHDKTRYGNSGGSFDRIMSNIQLAINNNIDVIARFNFTKDNIWGIHSVLKILSSFSNKERITVAINRVWQDEDEKCSISQQKKMDDEMDRINRSILELGMQNVPKELGIAFVNSCYADKKNESLINYDGSVFKCNARDFTKERQLGKLMSDGSIQWNEKESVWMASKLDDPICLKCFLVPICGGGCRRILFETSGRHYCLYNDDIEEKNKVLLELLKS